MNDAHFKDGTGATNPCFEFVMNITTTTHTCYSNAEVITFQNNLEYFSLILIARIYFLHGKLRIAPSSLCYKIKFWEVVIVTLSQPNPTLPTLNSCTFAMLVFLLLNQRRKCFLLDF